MPPVPPQSRWHCYACNSYFPEPVRTNEDELPLCPNCTSDVVVDRESESEDGWQTDGSADREQGEDPPSPALEPAFPGFFNPPSMTGNRTTEPRRQPSNNNSTIGGGFLGMLGSALGMMGDGNQEDNGNNDRTSNNGGPSIRTFRFGTPGGGGMVAGGSISFGGPSRLARGQDGRIPLMESPNEQRSNIGQDTNRLDQDNARHGPARQGPDEIDQFLAGLLGGPVRQMGGRPDGPAVFTNARPGGIATNRPDTIEGMMSALMMHLMNPQDDELPWLMRSAGLGAADQGRLGDYVYTQEGFDQVMERMMEAAGQHNHPPPASDTVIEGLPRVKLDSQTLESIQETNSSCNICFDDFQLDEEVVRIPCKHIFHTPCLVPWLKQNGTCPVCRFSLVPDAEAQRSAASASSPGGSQDTPMNPFAAVLSGLSGLLGGSNTASTSTTGAPASETTVQVDDGPRASDQQADEPRELSSSGDILSPVAITASGETAPASGAESQSLNDERHEQPPIEGPVQYTSGISDYRETMRRREQELRHRQTQTDNEPGRRGE